MSIHTIGLLGFGEVGSRLLDDLLGQTDVNIVLWDKQFTDSASMSSARCEPYRETARVSIASNALALGEQSELIISAVTANQALPAMSSALGGLKPDRWYMDVNSVSPRTKQAMADQVDAAGARFVEASIMSPIDPRRIASPVLLSGPHAGEFLTLARSLGFVGAEVCSEDYGIAAATKMCRSVMIKGMEALVTESLLAAHHYGVQETVLASLNNLFPRPDWSEHARYLISRSLEHGIRRAEEMREAAETVAEAGIEPWMSRGCVERQDWAPQFASALAHQDLNDMLVAIRRQLEA